MRSASPLRLADGADVLEFQGGRIGLDVDNIAILYFV
jgi:hypothetical protein